MARSSIVMICKNIKFDRDNMNVLTYSENQILTLCQTYAVRTATNYSFVGGHNTNTIVVNFSYSECLSCNYLAFQNKDYNLKWYFAFIDTVEYVSDGATKIHFTVDIFHTWWNYWDSKRCFVVREHVNDDTVGANTIPEGLETGEYISAKLQPTNSNPYTTCFCVAVSDFLFNFYSTLNELVPSGLYYIGVKTLKGVKDIIKLYDDRGKIEAINSIFAIPDEFFSSWATVTDIDGQISTTVKFSTNLTNLTITKVNYLANDYIPVNKKLLCFPYSFLQVSNHNGVVVNYYWEEFNKLPIENPASTDIRFAVKGALVPGGSFMCTPINYRNILNNNDDGIPLGKYPVGGWSTDPYTNWLTQQSLNIAGVKVDPITVGAVAGTAGLALGSLAAIATGGVSAAIGASFALSGAEGIWDTMQAQYKHDLTPQQALGNTNVGDFSFAFGLTSFEFKRMSIKEEYARCIDEYFTRFGYKVNRLKLPNQVGRTYYNYVQIGKGELLCYQKANVTAIPPQDLIQLNRLYQRGITLWHDYTNFGDYSVSNTITPVSL